MKHLILGGARSGKSRFAEQQALQVNKQVHEHAHKQTAKTDQQTDQAEKTSKRYIYIATGQAGDAEMQTRIAHHQQSRDDHWQLIEEPLYLASQLNQFNDTNTVVLIDCLTLWLSNCMHHNCYTHEKTQLLDALQHVTCDVFMVSNEVGSGVVPLGQLSRDFVDNAGWLHQELAKQCDRVTLVMAGLPLTLK